MINLCPSCEKPAEKLKVGGFCPNCNTKLRIKEVTDNGRIYETVDAQKEPEERKLLYDEGWRKIYRLSEEHYEVQYINTIIQGWVECPKCWRKLFQSNIIRGQLSPKCPRCSTVTDYLFNL